MQQPPDRLYLLADGTYASPDDISRSDDGRYRHRNGVHVALGDDGEPVTIANARASNARAAEMVEEEMRERAALAASPPPSVVEPVAQSAGTAGAPVGEETSARDPSEEQQE